MAAKRLFIKWYCKTNRKTVTETWYSNYNTKEWCLQYIYKGKIGFNGYVIGHLRNVDALISIGPNTTKELISRNLSPVESAVHTIEGTIELAKIILSKN